MKLFALHRVRRPAFTLMELLVAMVASAFLLAGLGSVMYIARETAYAPTAAARRAQTEDVVNLISDELRYATIITQQTPQILEFVVADRNNDGAAERIRYEWSGTPGDPLRKTLNGGTAVDVLTSVYAFSVTFDQNSKTTNLTATSESAEAILLANSAASRDNVFQIDDNHFTAQQINPAYFSGLPSNAVSWTATKLDFYGRQSSNDSQTLIVQLRSAGDPLNGPTSNVIGQGTIAESSITDGWNTVVFPSPIRNLAFNRDYHVVFTQAPSGGESAARIYVSDTAPSGVFETSNGGASWTYNTTRQMYGRLYGTYTTPGPSYNITRNYVSDVHLGLQSGSMSSARIDASVPLRNSPELLANYWRTDFDRDPTTTDSNGDAAPDWAVTGGGSFDTNSLASGIWAASGAIETRPLSNFDTTTTVEVSCRNTSVGGNGAVIVINADRSSGTYAPLLVYLQKQSDGSQNLTLSGRTSDSATKQLFTRSKLSSDFVRIRLTVLPASNVVNLQINDEDQGTFTYPTYAPTSTTDGYLKIYADTSSADFDYVDLRVGTN
ncbi:MAG TPA: prepilin-type N-terminal cleavage/methylation domain-containing protein [Lacipirellulaceae bacterium]|nr:prepilin-type N-terminal cleavage/methylation domain-containing protein [Lacipirellulaceae bacterium]